VGKLTLTPEVLTLVAERFKVLGEYPMQTGSGGVPVAQSLNGPQLKRSYMLNLAWQWGF